MRDGESFSASLQLGLYQCDEFESMDGLTQDERYQVLCRNVLRFLTNGWSDNWFNLLSYDVLHAVFIKRNHNFLMHFRHAFLQGFINLYHQLKEKEYSQSQIQQSQWFISSCLSLLPYTDLNQYEIISLPQYINAKWHLVKYRVEPIELTQHTGVSSLVHDHDDRVFAYGLTPDVEKQAACHLIFMGTTYPQGQGFTPQVATDLESCATVGTALYATGKNRLARWIDKQCQPIDVCGTSLGGSLSLLCAIDQGDKLRQVTALNPAGIYPDEYHQKMTNWQQLNHNKPLVTVLSQADDAVSQFGLWLPDWTFVKLHPEQQHKAPNGILDHMVLYAGLAGCRFEVHHADKVNRDPARVVRNRIWYRYLRSAVFYLLIQPYRYWWRPLISAFWNNKEFIVLFSALTLTFCFFPVLSAGLSIPVIGSVGSLIVNAAIPSLGISFIGKDLVTIGSKAMRANKTGRQRHLSNFYQHAGLSSLSLAVTFAAILVLFTLSTTVLTVGLGFNPTVLALLIPLVVYSGFQLAKLVDLACNGPQNRAPIHRPDTPRVNAHDIYQVEKTQTVEVRQLAGYFWVKRCLLTDKSFTRTQAVVVDSEKTTKNKVLRWCLDPQKHHRKLRVTASVAHIDRMIEISTVAHTHGLFGRSKTEVPADSITYCERIERQYQAGKVR